MYNMLEYEHTHVFIFVLFCLCLCVFLDSILSRLDGTERPMPAFDTFHTWYDMFIVFKSPNICVYFHK